MPRPRKCRMIGFVPNNSCFYPQLLNKDEVILEIEEIEALRLSDFLEVDQDTAAKSMNVSRGTFQRIVTSARKKIADALIHGKTIKIHGGCYELAQGKQCCKRHNGKCNCMSKSCDGCDDCKK